MTSQMSYQITQRSLSSPPELGAAQARPMIQEVGKTHFPLPTTEFPHYPIPLSPLRPLDPHLPVLAAEGLQQEGPTD